MVGQFVAAQGPQPVPLGKGLAGVEGHRPLSADLKPESSSDRSMPVNPAPAADRRESHAGEGEASFYGSELAGRRTASGERFVPSRLTAAHRTLPLGSQVRVTNMRNGASVVVRVNDRGPFHGRRVIDLSEAAARQIGMLRAGTARVRLALLR